MTRFFASALRPLASEPSHSKGFYVRQSNTPKSSIQTPNHSGKLQQQPQSW